MLSLGIGFRFDSGNPIGKKDKYVASVRSNEIITAPIYKELVPKIRETTDNRFTLFEALAWHYSHLLLKRSRIDTNSVNSSGRHLDCGPIPVWIRFRRRNGFDSICRFLTNDIGVRAS